MSAELFKPAIAYLAQGRIRIKAGETPPRTVDSAYAHAMREKTIRAQQKHSWKGDSNEGSPFSGAVLWGKSAMSTDVPAAITSICGGKSAGGLLYSFESGSLCALLEVQGAEEQRLWNDNRTRLRHISISRATGTWSSPSCTRMERPISA